MKEKKLYYLPINNNFLKEINYEEKEVTINLDLSFLDN
jgi:ribosomal 30S subunit maturation factor RimM